MPDNLFRDASNQYVTKPEDAVVEWRPSVYGLLRNDKGEILMITSVLSPGEGWEFPGGGMKLDETPQEALAREFYEETGYRVNVHQPLSVHAHNYYHRKGTYCRALLFVFEVSLASSERNAAIVNTVDGDEIASMKWVPAQDLTQESCHPMFSAVLDSLMGA